MIFHLIATSKLKYMANQIFTKKLTNRMYWALPNLSKKKTVCIGLFTNISSHISIHLERQLELLYQVSSIYITYENLWHLET